MNLHRFALLTTCATIGLITAGGLVKSTGSGLAVPDWPLSYGMLFPPMVGGILYEHGHRLAAAVVWLLTVGLAFWLGCREPRRWVRRLGVAAVAAISAQALLGGLTVLLLLPAPVSIAHACIAPLFFGLLVTITVVTSPQWTCAAASVRATASARATASVRAATTVRAGARAPSAARRGGPEPGRRLLRLAGAMTAAIYLQLILGALVRHTGAGLAIPDFPLAFGRLLPPLDSPLVALHFLHRLGALAVTGLVAATVACVLREHRHERTLLAPGLLLAPLVLLQILLGAFTVWTGLAVGPATAHVTAGAVLLATSLVLTLRAAVTRSTLPEPAAVAALAPRTVMP